MVNILGFHCSGLGSIPDWGTENPVAKETNHIMLSLLCGSDIKKAVTGFQEQLFINPHISIISFFRQNPDDNDRYCLVSFHNCANPVKLTVKTDNMDFVTT